MDKKQYDVFISYSRDDYWDRERNEIPGNVVSLIKDAFKNEGINYWIDEEGIAPGDNFPEHIANIIGLSHIMVFISSKNSICQSRWTSTEVALASEHGKLIIPVRIDDTPYIKNNGLAIRIATLSYIDYYKNPEKGLKDLIERIKSYIEVLKEKEEKERLIEEKRIKEEEERKKKETEEQERLISELKQAQKELIAGIMNECEDVNLEETAVNNKRELLLLKTKDIKDRNEREEVKARIRAASPIRQINQKELENLQGQVKDLEDRITALKEENENLINQIQKREGAISIFNKKLYKPIKSIIEEHSVRLKFGLIFVFILISSYVVCTQIEFGSSIKPLNEIECEYDSQDLADGVSCIGDEWADSLYFILNGLTKVEPQLQVYIDGYNNDVPSDIYSLGMCFEKGKFLEGHRNMKIAGYLVHIAADKGYPPAQTTLGLYFYYGCGGYICDYDSSSYWFREAIKNGSSDAKFYLGQAYDMGNIEHNLHYNRTKGRKAKEYYIAGAEAGHVRSQLYLGIYYYQTGNYSAARTWIEKSLTGNLSPNEKAKAFFVMGKMCIQSEGEKKKAFAYYSRAATTGDGYVEAMYYLGECYEDGDGTKQDFAKAEDWYKKAANRGYKKAIKKVEKMRKKKKSKG